MLCIRLRYRRPESGTGVSDEELVYVLAGLALVISGAAGRGDEKKVPLSEVPKVVLDAVRARFPGAELKEAEKEVEEDEATFEISLTAAGKHVTVSVDDEGEIEEIETEYRHRRAAQGRGRRHRR